MESTLTEGALTEAIYRLLRCSWEPIEYKYDALTRAERDCITREQFAELARRATGPTIFWCGDCSYRMADADYMQMLGILTFYHSTEEPKRGLLRGIEGRSGGPLLIYRCPKCGGGVNWTEPGETPRN